MEYVVLAVVFLATLLAIVGGYTFVNRRRIAAADVIRSRLLDNTLQIAPAAQSTLIRSGRSLSTIPFLDRLLEGKGFAAAAQAELDRAGSKQTVGTVALTMLLGAAVGGVVGNRLAGPLMGAALAALGTFAPIAVLKRQQAARSKKFEQQLPEAVDMLVNAMKAGYSLQAAMRFIGDEMPEPIGPEFTRFYDEQRLGMEVRAALVSLQERIGTLDMKMFVTALLIQRETGGNLAEILTNISSLMRERVALLGQIDVLTAEPRMSAIVLTALPIVIFAVINFMNPDYVRPLYTTPTGNLMLAYSVVSIAIGYFVMQRIGKIDI